MLSNASGVTVEATEYMPFGPMREHAGSVISNYKYTDQELDPETGHISPELKRVNVHAYREIHA